MPGQRAKENALLDEACDDEILPGGGGTDQPGPGPGPLTTCSADGSVVRGDTTVVPEVSAPGVDVGAPAPAPALVPGALAAEVRGVNSAAATLKRCGDVFAMDTVGDAGRELLAEVSTCGGTHGAKGEGDAGRDSVLLWERLRGCPSL